MTRWVSRPRTCSPRGWSLLQKRLNPFLRILPQSIIRHYLVGPLVGGRFIECQLIVEHRLAEADGQRARSENGSDVLAHGVKQVTYAGHPLYVYSGDSGPHQTDYVGQVQFGGAWYAIGPGGHDVR